jgi:hypothetical protein
MGGPSSSSSFGGQDQVQAKSASADEPHNGRMTLSVTVPLGSYGKDMAGTVSPDDGRVKAIRRGVVPEPRRVRWSERGPP